MESPRDCKVLIVSNADDRLVLDVEGLVANQDGTCVFLLYVEHLYGFEVKSYDSFWISDEYGPYIYRFSQTGQLIQTIQPVNAVLPKDSSGALDFTSESDPATGRAVNQGNFFFILIPSEFNISIMKDSKVSQSTRVPKPCTRCFNRLQSKTVAATRASPGSLRMTCRTPLSSPPWLENGSFHSH